MSTISTAQSEIQEALQALSDFIPQLPAALKPLIMLAPPKGLRVHVSLRHGDEKKSRQIKSTAPADSWSPDADFVLISYEEAPEIAEQSASLSAKASPEAHELKRTPIKPLQIAPLQRTNEPGRDLLLALAKAESTSQFVSLKWFRDTFLPQQGLLWAVEPEERHRVLADAINRRWVLTSRVPNPKNPQFPVTTIRANRPLAEVREILEHDSSSRSPFAPVTIMGEPLSQTVIHERR